jgi:hypothetical protein
MRLETLKGEQVWECRKDPPTPDLDDGVIPYGNGVWPSVETTNWCGAYKPGKRV